MRKIILKYFKWTWINVLNIYIQFVDFLCFTFNDMTCDGTLFCLFFAGTNIKNLDTSFLLHLNNIIS